MIMAMVKVFFQGQYMEMLDNIDQVYNKIFILIFLGFIFGTRVNKNRATISPIGLGLINMYMYMFILYMYICLYLGMHQAFSSVNL